MTFKNISVKLPHNEHNERLKEFKPYRTTSCRQWRMGLQALKKPLNITGEDIKLNHAVRQEGNRKTLKTDTRY